jgi:hypothetical protein
MLVTAARWLFAPLIDVEGTRTPSRAARLWLWMVLVPVYAWARQVSDSTVILSLAITGLVASLLLPAGWWLLSLAAGRFEGLQT